LGGLPAAINPGIFLGAKTIAATFLDLLTEPALLKPARDEFVECTGGGIGGARMGGAVAAQRFQAAGRFARSK
jgi:aminobenzoyl-glutamate utilization protein B